jgi:parallel beta-helix repeat protein
VALSPDKGVVDVELFDGYPAAETLGAFKIEIFAADTRTLRTHDYNFSKPEVIDARHIRLTKHGGRAGDLEQLGDIVAIGSSSPAGRGGHAVTAESCVNLKLDGINLFASPCFGFLEFNCDGSTYHRCHIDRRPPADDLLRRADPRIRSLNADAYHSKHAVKGPSYLECSARFQGDDCINICGDYHMIMGSEGKNLRVLAKHDMNIKPGDPVELVTYDGRRLPDGKVAAITPSGDARDADREFISKQRMDAGLKSGRGPLAKAYTVTLDREVEIAMGGVICSASRIGNGFLVKGCTFGFNRSRGILIKASRGEVVGNHLEGCWMSAVLVAPEYWWLEAGSSSDLKIAGNVITACKGVPINIEATAGNGQIAAAGAHQNLSITGNTIGNCTMPGIVVQSTSGLRIEGNKLDLVTPKTPVPHFMKQAGIDSYQPVVEINCKP